jgi:hypothetical protein
MANVPVKVPNNKNAARDPSGIPEVRRERKKTHVSSEKIRHATLLDFEKLDIEDECAVGWDAGKAL